MRSEELREELERWVERVMSLKETVEEVPPYDVYVGMYYLKEDVDAILIEGLRREK